MAPAREMVLQAEGMTCPGCAGDMEALLRERTGIIEASVDYAGETIFVRYNPLLLDRKGVFMAVRALGYGVRILREA